MRKHLLTIALVALNIVTATALFYTSWRCKQWEMHAMINAKFAGAICARRDYDMGRIIRMRLAIRDEAENRR